MTLLFWWRLPKVAREPAAFDAASVGRFGKRPRKPCTRSRIGPTGASRKSSVSGNRVLALRAGGFWYEFGIGRRCQPVPPLASRVFDYPSVGAGDGPGAFRSAFIASGRLIRTGPIASQLRQRARRPASVYKTNKG